MKSFVKDCLLFGDKSWISICLGITLWINLINIVYILYMIYGPT